MAPDVFSKIEIAASPDAVRTIFLNSQRYEDWNHYFKFVCSQQPADLEVGDKIKVNIKGSVLGVSIMENSATSFQWRGGLGSLVSGTHGFYFSPSQMIPGGTTLVQKEEFAGLFGSLVPVFVSTVQLKLDFEAFNEQLKLEAEKGAHGSV